jgi:hypothetical protein
VDTSDQRLVHLPNYCCTELHKACNYEWDLWLDASSGSSGRPPSGVTLLQRSFCRTHFMPPAPPRGPPSTSPASVVAATGPVASTPQGACHQRLQLRWWPLLDLPPAPPGARHRHLQLWWWPLLDLPTAPPKGARHRRFAKLGTCRQNFPRDTYQGGHRGKHCHYKQATWRKNGGKSLAKKNQILVVPRTRES